MGGEKMETRIPENISLELVFKDNLLLDLLSKGFHFDFKDEKHKQIVKNLKSYNRLYEFFDKINTVDDIVFIIINTEESLYPLLTYLINISVPKLKQILNHPYINKKHVNFIIDTLSLEILEDDIEILKVGIFKGYQFNEHTILLLDKNVDLLTQKLECFNGDTRELLNLVNNLSDKILSDNYLFNDAANISNENMKNGYFVKNIGENIKLYDKIWAQIK